VKPSARKIITCYFVLDKQLKNAGSVIGSQLDQIKECISIQSGKNQNEELNLIYLKFATHLQSFTEKEREVCKIRYGSDFGPLTTYEKLVSESDLNRKVYDDGSCELVTNDGETLITMEKGHAVVIGWKRECVSYKKIAEMLGMSAYEVKKIDHSACQKVRDSIASKGL
jgi:DNA-directed RNA polymerase specialized sigma subunit